MCPPYLDKKCCLFIFVALVAINMDCKPSTPASMPRDVYAYAESLCMSINSVTATQAGTNTQTGVIAHGPLS